MDNNSSTGGSRFSNNKLNQKILLSYFPLTIQDFQFNIYRKLKHDYEGKSLPQVSLRKLPNRSSENENPFYDYWVTSEKTIGFDEFICHSNYNIYLTLDILFQELERSCNRKLNWDTDYVINRDKFHRRIHFIIDSFEEGKQTVWLEPYYLRTKGIFGFLTDFQFITPSKGVTNRRIQVLSFSLDREGRSNKNFYIDRFEAINEFKKKFIERVFPIQISNSSIYIEKSFSELEPNLLDSKKYIFSNGKTNISQFTGIKNNGPYKIIDNLPKVYFIFQKKDRPYADDLFKALRGDTYKNTFPGMEPMFKYKFSKENVSGKEITNFDFENLMDTIESILEIENSRKTIPIVIFPSSKNSDLESKRLYYQTKYAFLKKRLTSQFVSIDQFKQKDRLKWSIANIGLGLFAKMGGEPWKVNPATKKCLIIGLGQAHSVKNGKVNKFFAYSILTESNGLYKEIKILGQTKSKGEYLRDFRENLLHLLQDYSTNYDTIMVHTTYKITHEEISIVQKNIDSIINDSKNSTKFIVMKFNDKNKFFGYSMSSNSMVPYESTYVRLSNDEYLVWFEGLQFHNPNLIKKIERPIHIEFLYPKHGLTDDEKKSYLQDAVNLSGANWRGFNAKSLPVSIFYAYLVAEFYKEFQYFDWEDIKPENINPWFL